MVKNFHDKNLTFKTNKANSSNFLKYNRVRCAFRPFSGAPLPYSADWPPGMIQNIVNCKSLVLQKSNPKFKLNPCWRRLAHEKIIKAINRRSLALRKSLSFDIWIPPWCTALRNFDTGGSPRVV